MKIETLLGLLLSLICLALLGGCASTQKSMVVPYDLRIEVDPKVNPNQQAIPSPILIGLYELSSDSQFMNLDFAAAQDQARSALGSDLISIDQLILRPGEHRMLRRSGNAAAHQLGIVAGYRELTGRVWRVSIPLPGTKSTNLYKFWQISPRRMALIIEVGQDGIKLKRRH